MPLDKRQSTRRPLINVPASAPTHSPSAYSSRRRNTAHLPTWRRLFRLTVLKRYAVSLSFLAGFLVCWGLVWSSSAVSWRGSQGQERLAGFEGKPSAGDLLRGEQGSELFRSSTGILASIAAQPPLPPPSITPSFTSAPLHTDDPIHDFQPSTHLGVDHSSALRPADDSNGVIPLDGSSSSSSSTNNDSPDMTPIFIDTRASSIPSTQPSSNEVFLSYLPHSGYHNGRVSLANALLLSRALNATLLLPPAFLSSKPIAFRSIPVLRSKLVKTIAARTNDAATCAAGGHRRMSARANGQGREGDEDMIVGGLTKDGSDAVQVSGGVRGKKAAAAAAAVDKARGRPGHRKAAGVVGGSPKKHARRCEGWNSTTLVSWEWLVDLESLRQEGFRWTEWWDLKDESLGRAPIGLDVLGRDSVQMWGENADRYDRQIILGEVGDEDLSLLSSGVYTAQSTLEDLRKESQGKRHLRFGSLFGTERLIVAPSSSLTATSTSSNDSDDQSSEDWTRLKLVVQRAMAVELSDGGTLSAVVMAERERLNGGMDVYRPDKTGSGDLEGGKEGTGGPSGYIGLHCRLDESLFSSTSGLTTRRLFYAILTTHFSLSPTVAEDLERSLWETSASWRAVVLGDDAADGDTAFPPPPSLFSNTVNSSPSSKPPHPISSFTSVSSSSTTVPASQRPLVCPRPLYTTPTHLLPLNTPLFIATDSKPSHPALEIFSSFFPCLFYLNDLIPLSLQAPLSKNGSSSSSSSSASVSSSSSSKIDRLKRLHNASDGVPLFPFLVPFLDGLIAAGARVAMGTPKSTMSSWIVAIENPKAWNDHGGDEIE